MGTMPELKRFDIKHVNKCVTKKKKRSCQYQIKLKFVFVFIILIKEQKFLRRARRIAPRRAESANHQLPEHDRSSVHCLVHIRVSHTIRVGAQLLQVSHRLSQHNRHTVHTALLFWPIPRRTQILHQDQILAADAQSDETSQAWPLLGRY